MPVSIIGPAGFVELALVKRPIERNQASINDEKDGRQQMMAKVAQVTVTRHQRWQQSMRAREVLRV